MKKCETIEHGGVTVVVHRRTPRTNMVFRTIVNRMIAIWQDIADSIGVPADSADNALSLFAEYSARVRVDKGRLDFEFADAHDSAEAVRDKFLTYLDTGYMDLIDEIDRVIRVFDNPAPDVTSPKPLPENASEKKDS